MVTPEEEFDTYTSRGEQFDAEQQVANLLWESQNFTDLQHRVSDCRSSYLTELQVLLMGYHEDFLAIGRNMKKVCSVVEELKQATRDGRTAIGDVSAWTLPSAGADSESGFGAAGGKSTFALGDPWASQGGGDGADGGAAGSAFAAGGGGGGGASEELYGRNHNGVAVLPIAFLADLARDPLRSAGVVGAAGGSAVVSVAGGGAAASSVLNGGTGGDLIVDGGAQAAALITAARRTQRLLHSAQDRVYRRSSATRQILALKEIEELADGAADHLGGRAAATSLAMLRAALLDSFQDATWVQHPLGIGDIEPRWRLLAEAGRLASASALLLRCHSALAEDFSAAFVSSPVDVRNSALRLSSTLSAVIQHAGQLRRAVCGSFDAGALAAWAMAQVRRVASRVFAMHVERMRHVVPEGAVAASASDSSGRNQNNNAGGGGAVGAAAFRASAIRGAAESIAIDITLALNFAACEDESGGTASDGDNNTNSYQQQFADSSNESDGKNSGPLAHSILRVLQPAQLQLLWDQVQTAIATDFAFAPADASDPQLLAQIAGAVDMPRQCCVRCLSPTLAGVQRHGGLVALFDSEAWLSACQRAPTTDTVQRLSDALLAANVSDATNALWDHLTRLVSFRRIVEEAATEMNSSLTASDAASSSSAADDNNYYSTSTQVSSEQQSRLVDFYFSRSPDWVAQLDLCAARLITAFAEAVVQYRASVGAQAMTHVCLHALSQQLDAEEHRKHEMMAQAQRDYQRRFDEYHHLEQRRRAQAAVAATAAARGGGGSAAASQEVQAPAPPLEAPTPPTAPKLAPPVLHSFRPELFVSALDCAILSSLSVLGPASRVASELLQSNFPRFFSSSENHQHHQQNKTVIDSIVPSLEQSMFRVAIDAVFFRNPSTLRTRMSSHDLRLHADGGGSLSLRSDFEQQQHDENQTSNDNAQLIAERAAMFVLLPFAFGARGAGELRWWDSSSSSSSSGAAPPPPPPVDLLVPLTAHKIALLLMQCSRAGGPAVAAQVGLAMAAFMCDEAAFLSTACWDTVRQRAPVFRSYSAADLSAAMLKTIAVSLYILAPAFDAVSLSSLPLFSPSSSSSSGSSPSAGTGSAAEVVERHFVQHVMSSSTAGGGVGDEGAYAQCRRLLLSASLPPSAGRMNFSAESGGARAAAVVGLEDLVRNFEGRDPFVCADYLPECCWRTPVELRGMVAEVTSLDSSMLALKQAITAKE